MLNKIVNSITSAVVKSKIQKELDRVDTAQITKISESFINIITDEIRIGTQVLTTIFDENKETIANIAGENASQIKELISLYNKIKIVAETIDFKSDSIKSLRTSAITITQNSKFDKKIVDGVQILEDEINKLQSNYYKFTIKVNKKDVEVTKEEFNAHKRAVLKEHNVFYSTKSMFAIQESTEDSFNYSKYTGERVTQTRKTK